jgi:hypothetical protein
MTMEEKVKRTINILTEALKAVHSWQLNCLSEFDTGVAMRNTAWDLWNLYPGSPKGGE